MIGARLKEERERLGFTQEDFASLAEASKRSQIEWEKGSAFPNACALEKFANVGADIQYVVTGKRQLTTALMSSAVESAFKMVQSGAVTVTPQQFAQMAMALLPVLEVTGATAVAAAMNDEGRKRVKAGKTIASNISGNAQVAQGSGILQVGGKSRTNITKK